MLNTNSEYCGDAEMVRRLEKAGSSLSLSQTYGLFYGCHAAPHIVEPAQYMSLILDKESEDQNSLEDTTTLLGSLISLWNHIADWDPEKISFSFPDVSYSDTHEGTAARLRDNYSLIESFVRGLDMGHVAESDFSKGGMEALKSLSEAGALLSNFAELLVEKESRDNIQLEKVLDSTMQLEDLAAYSIAKLNIALKDARKREADWLNILTDPDKKIKGDASCPCGSGKKYNRCCGLVN